jgi:putative ATP-dependent endonuclease of the OLD family
MILAHIRVNNYKALLDTETEASRFVCVVGENNAGKSSLMQAVIRLLGTKPISKHEYYDPTKPVVISGLFTGVTDVDIERLHPDHREDIRSMIREGQLGLVRRYEPDGTTKQLRIITKIPKVEKFRQDAIANAFKGVAGKEIATKMKTFYPEVTITNNPSTQKAALNLIAAHVLSFGPDDLEDADVPLVTGIDNSIRAILPEPIYIPAVKDFSDDLQTKAGTSFGKILNILLSMIEGDLADADQLLKICGSACRGT